MQNKVITTGQRQSMWEEVVALLVQTKRPGIGELIHWLKDSDFTIAPASTRYHGSYESGLMEHSLTVYKECLKFQPLIKLFKIPEDTLIIAGLLHDICKVNYYNVEERNTKNEQGKWVKVPYYAVEDNFPIGHAEKSIILLQSFIQLTDVEIAMIRNHMGAFQDTPQQVSHLFNKFPEALVLHFADMAATYVVESPGLPPELANNLKEYINGKQD